eukprot:795985-Alexandrium_andersonii.AAC.1
MCINLPNAVGETGWQWRDDSLQRNALVDYIYGDGEGGYNSFRGKKGREGSAGGSQGSSVRSKARRKPWRPSGWKACQ